MDFTQFFPNYSQALVIVLIKWTIDAAIQSLPAPHPVNPSPFYVWFYNFANVLAANIRLINKESETRTIVRNKLLGTENSSMKVKEEAVEDAKNDILAVRKEKLEAEMAGPIK